MKIKYIAIFLVLLSCIMGTACAADVSTDLASDSVDDVAVDAVQEEISDSSTVDETIEPTVSDDITIGEINGATIEKENNDVEQNRGTPDNAPDWTELRRLCEFEGIDYDITLNGTSYIANSQIVFGNSATITGTSDSYITGGTNTLTPFYSDDDTLSISFVNVKFVNMNVNNLLELGGTVTLENCTFTNINTALGHNSVVYNIQGTMDIVGCNFTNNYVGYGTITNYNNQTLSDATMTVDNCRFINNSAEVEPGAINNCGNLEVTNSVFDNNYAKWWAGAIHSHNYANTTINNCNFTNNGAGWNGGALYTYSNLMVNNSRFINNSCKTTAGGGAIGSSSGWISTVNYNITIENCHFENNTNNASLTNQTPAQGNGGAISAMNRGILDVHGSTFINNYAARGQAISAYGAGYIDPEGNITEGIPKVVIYNNTFIDHNRTTTTDTAYLTGNYSLDNNTFINCHQTNTGTNNIFINCTPESVNNADHITQSDFSKSKNILSNSQLLEDDSNIRYINTSLAYDQSQDGLSWETAYGSAANGISSALAQAPDGAIIYIDGQVSRKKLYKMSNPITLTFIGYDDDDSISNLCMNYEMTDNCITWTLINLTIKNCDFSKNCNFINCRFESNVTFSKTLASYDRRALVENGNDVARNFTLENCTFENYEGSSPIVTSYEFSNLILRNCTFNNINSDSIFYHGVDLQQDDGISLYDCKFTNCNLKGVVDFAGNIDVTTYIAIENCDYDFDATTDIVSADEYAHNYLNATKLKPIPVDSAVDISSSEKGVVVIALTDNSSAPIAGATVKYTVNGGEEQTDVTGEDGKFTITGLTGEVTIAVNYEGNESFNPITGSQFFNFTEEPAPSNDTNGTNDTPAAPTKVATKLTAPKVTATYNVAKKLVITLKDANGKVLANKKVTVKVGTISKTLKTNAKGQVSVAVNTLVPKTYTATVKFAGDNDYKASSLSAKVTVKKAAPKLTAAKKTFKVKAKTKKVTATLKNNKGKVLKKVKLTLKIGKKTYTAKTNSKGVATFKVKLTKKGTYTGTVKFAGSKYFKAATKKVKIAVKK